jgi:hypothetical protein
MQTYLHLHSKNNRFGLICSILFYSVLLSISFSASSVQKSDTKSIINSAIAIDKVWSGHRVKPALLTRNNHQFVSYYDDSRQLTVAHRILGKPWRYYKVDSWVGWDSHNYITMELDPSGNLHVMGNMHADTLEYFRTTEAYQVRSLKRVPLLVEKALEQRMTYPVFMLNKAQELIVKYRDGGSGNGNEIYNFYDTETKQWSRLHQNRFLDGEGKMNAYPEGPHIGPDGLFHLIWVWRNTPDAATNHSLSYARSPDLVSWQDASGNTLSLPLTLDTAEVVDPVPPFGGMINGNVKLGFDQRQRPIISYHKYDKQGNTQMYVARFQNSTWKSVQISDWKGFRWDFGGGGSLGRFAVKPYSPELLSNGDIGVMVRLEDEVMRFVLNSESLQVKRIETANIYPPEIDNKMAEANQFILVPDDSSLETQVIKGIGDLSPNGRQYYLSWQSQPANRDRAHSFIPQAGTLLLHELKAK